MVDQLFADAYLAASYDLWHPRSVRDDYDFYLPWIMAAQDVLDVGCGTGTLLAEARAAGHRGRLCGLDPAAAMLARARRRADVEWALGDLSGAVWREAFDLAVMTGHAFQALVADAEIDGALAAIHRALRPAGRFAFETRNPGARAWERWRPQNAVTVQGEDGCDIRITTQVVKPFDGRTVTFTHTFEGAHPSLPQVSRSTLRFLDGPSLAARLGDHGFEIEAQFGDFGGGPITADSPEIVTIARKPG
jgi:SAM-dependent methyltransferase